MISLTSISHGSGQVSRPNKKDIDTLIVEAESNGNFVPAVDKAIFEASQNPGERERYIGIIQNLASKTIQATEQEKVKIGKEGLTDRIASLGKRIEDPRVCYNLYY